MQGYVKGDISVSVITNTMHHTDSAPPGNLNPERFIASDRTTYPNFLGESPAILPFHLPLKVFCFERKLFAA